MRAATQPTGTACNTRGALNVGRMLAGLVAPLLPGNLRPVVVNGSMPDPAPPTGADRRPPVREAAAVIDAACCEMLGWGAAITFSRLLVVADEVAPGLSFPWTAWQCFCALSEAVRGNLLHALQGLPIGAVLPAALREAVGNALQDLVPSGLGSVRAHQDLVIGLACGAVLYEMGRQRPVEAVRSATGRAVLHRLRQLRAVLNIVSGLQHLPAAAATAAAGDRAVPALSAPALPHRGASGRLCAWKGHGDELQPTLPPHVAGDGATGSSWPLPGAAARSGKSNAAPPRKPAPPKPVAAKGSRRTSLAKPASPDHRARPAKGVVAGVGAAASGSSGGADPGAAVGSAAAGGADAGGAGAAEANKEAMFAMLPGKKSRKLPTAPLYSDPATATPASMSSATPQVAGAPESGAGSPPPAERLLPTCVRFHHAGEAGRQVRKSRFDVPMPRFCVHDGARALFEAQFDVGTDPGAHREDWIVGLPIRERYAQSLRQATITKYSGLGQLDRQAPQSPVALGEDSIYIVASISLLSEHALQRHRPGVAQVLEPDTFRLVEHIQLDGRRRLFMAYVIQRCTGTVPAAGAGLLEIRQDPDGFRMQDPASGFTLHGDSLVNLVIGIERVSGWRFHPDADALQAIDAQGEAPVGTPASLSLFVSKEAMADGGACVGRTRLQRRAQFLEPVNWGPPDAGRRLLRNCFSLVQGTIVAVDAQGLLHALVFTPVDTAADVGTLNAQRGPGREFLQSLGLHAGRRYALKEVGAVLLRHGFSEVLDGAVAAPPGATGFQLHRSSALARQPVALPDEPRPGRQLKQDRDVDEQQVPSTFSLHDDRIRYVDHNAAAGTLLLTPHGTAPARWVLATANPPAALRFARDNGMQPGLPYTLQELAWLLYGNGFVQRAR